MNMMISKPCLSPTIINSNNYEWRPKTFDEFLKELEHVQKNINEACMFRGQRRLDWLLDSTIARSFKQMRGMPIIKRYSEIDLEDTQLQHQLAKLWLKKVKSVQLSPELLALEAQGADVYFEYHRHHQQNPDDKFINDVDPKGTNFIDFSYDWKVALFFANNRRKESDEGVVYIVRQAVLGPVYQTKPYSHTIENMQNALLDKDKAYGHLPLMIYPQGQVNNSLDPKPKRQSAVYIAQMDFRFDLELSWKLRHLMTDNQVYIKMVLPAGTQKEVATFLDTEGITQEYLFPPTVFDKQPIGL